jgi:hypothetical protein
VARFFIAKESTFKNSLKQPLTYLLQELRQQTTGISWTFEGWLLLEDQQAKFTFVKDPTVEKFRSLADAFTKGVFPLRPQLKVCPRCPHYFYCSQRG